MGRPEPIIEYAHKIGKSTAEFTVNDLTKFMKWWLKEPIREDLIKVTPEQRKVYEQDVTKVQKYFKEQRMSKNGQYNNAMRSRLSSDQVVDIDQVDMEEVEEVPAEAIVCSMELTRLDVDALLFCINRLNEDYEMAGHEYQKPLDDLREGLQGVE